MTIAWAIVLAVVPLERRPGGWQVLLSYLPAILLLIGVLLLPVLLRRFPWSRIFGFAPRKLYLAIAAVAVLGVLMVLICRQQCPLQPSAPAPAVSGQWPTFMCDPQRSGHAGGATGPVTGKKLWAYRDDLARAAFAGSAAVDNGRVYVGSDNRNLYCLNAKSGELLWKFKAACELFASPVVANGRVYLGEGLHHTNNAKLYCLDAASGRKLWEFATSGHIEFSPTLFDGKLYVAAGGDGIYCIDAVTGGRLWQYPSVHSDVSPAVTEAGVFFGSIYDNPAFYCVAFDTGKLVWRRPAPYGVCGSPSTAGKRVYFGLGNGTFGMSHAKPVGSVWCLSAADGSVLWNTTHVKDAVLTTVALWQGRAYFGSRDGHLYCVDGETGSPLWTFNTEEAVVSSPAVAGGRVYFGSNDGSVYCLDGMNGTKLWSYDTSQVAFNTDAQVMASPAVIDGRLYVGSMNFYFFCLGDDRATPGAQ